VRHGARASALPDYEGAFEVPVGMLTAQGMRQRYLLGKYNREKYIEKYNFLNPDYLSTQMYVESTDVFRTIQSTYDELLGLFPPGSIKHHLTET
jgi:hypothetical protein